MNQLQHQCAHAATELHHETWPHNLINSRPLVNRQMLNLGPPLVWEKMN